MAFNAGKVHYSIKKKSLSFRFAEIVFYSVVKKKYKICLAREIYIFI